VPGIASSHGLQVQVTATESMAARARAYQQLYGWPTGVDRATGRLVVAVSTGLNAIAMRNDLGIEIQSALSMQMLAGPVLAMPGEPADWVFLTGPASSVGARALSDLSRLGVRLIPPGVFVPLPPSRLDSGMVRWTSGPTVGRELPPWTAVIAAVRSVSPTCSVR
jgi:hypothetical protein